MPAHRSADPLVHVPLRLPASVVAGLRAKAVHEAVTLADVLRQHLTLAEAKPLAKPVPRKRPPKKLGSVSGVDPVLLCNLAGIGNNLNQLARAVNVGALTGNYCSSLYVLAELRALEQQIGCLVPKQ